MHARTDTHTQGKTTTVVGGCWYVASHVPFSKSKNSVLFHSRKGLGVGDLVFFDSPLYSVFCSLFTFLKQISRIKYGSHMLLLTIGIHHSTGPTTTHTDRQR